MLLIDLNFYLVSDLQALSYLMLPSCCMSFCHPQVIPCHIWDDSQQCPQCSGQLYCWHNLYLTSVCRTEQLLLACSLKYHRRVQLKKTWQSGISIWKRFGFHKPASQWKYGIACCTHAHFNITTSLRKCLSWTPFEFATKNFKFKRVSHHFYCLFLQAIFCTAES